jgi:hypothetical protein
MGIKGPKKWLDSIHNTEYDVNMWYAYHMLSHARKTVQRFGNIRLLTVCM